jgi:hypothetical protein
MVPPRPGTREAIAEDGLFISMVLFSRPHFRVRTRNDSPIADHAALTGGVNSSYGGVTKIGFRRIIANCRCFVRKKRHRRIPIQRALTRDVTANCRHEKGQTRVLDAERSTRSHSKTVSSIALPFESAAEGFGGERWLYTSADCAIYLMAVTPEHSLRFPFQAAPMGACELQPA